MEPRIKYAKTSDGVSIAYWTPGDGVPLVWPPTVPMRDGHHHLGPTVSAMELAGSSIAPSQSPNGLKQKSGWQQIHSKWPLQAAPSGNPNC